MWLATAKSAALTACLLLAGCTSLGYYAHLAKGQLALMQAREPISKIIADPARDPKLRERLAYALKARLLYRRNTVVTSVPWHID